MPNEVLSYGIEDMVLKLDKSLNPKNFRLSDYEKFLDILCGSREYQKQAVRTAFTFLFGDSGASILDIAKSNYASNMKLRERYRDLESYLNTFQFPEVMAAAIDLPTAAGKSYVMYAIARIALASGQFDRVLILCPSVTIESGLTEKFLTLIRDKQLNDLLAVAEDYSLPNILNGNSSFTENSICIENFHSILPSSGSSIRLDLVGRGQRTLVMNDECHHVYNLNNGESKKWKEFLDDSEFGFKFILGFSGTCYIGNEYFSDVIYRLPLINLIEMGFAKNIDYVTDDSSENEDEKFQKIYANHASNREQYRRVKPLTIFVTQTIDACKRLAKKFSHFLVSQEGISLIDAEEKILIATSAKEHSNNIPKLQFVDQNDSPTEWIFSVSMLSEGWDVKNVFQIVPHEERAFDSKLLISQVLGRGLRVPEQYRGERPVVKVFNHSSWSPRIKGLVESLLEFDTRIVSGPCSNLDKFNFEIHQIEKSIELKEITSNSDELNDIRASNLLVREVTLISQEEYLNKETVYSRIGEDLSIQKTTSTKIRYRMYPVEAVAKHIFGKIQGLDTEQGTHFTDDYTIDYLITYVKENLSKIGDESGMVSEKNRQILQSAFNIKDDTKNVKLRYHHDANTLKKLNTNSIPRKSSSISILKSGDGSIFYHEKSVDFSDTATQSLLSEILNDESLPRSAVIEIPNFYNYKTSFNFVVTFGKPERDFVKKLISEPVSGVIDAWIKSTDTGFYSIEYDFLTGGISRDKRFNPDFFILKSRDIFVIEIKDDSELSNPSEKNEAKFIAGKKHFEELNRMQDEYTYHFNFLTPADFEIFFSQLIKGNQNIVSSLDALFLNKKPQTAD